MTERQREDLRHLLDEMLAETGGLLTARERRDTERVLGLAPATKPKRARGRSTRSENRDGSIRS